ncbi:hypothetical protein [Streptomyces sp. NPDC054794]
MAADFSIYPHADLAVRTWAAQIDPACPWSAKIDQAFGPLWTGWAGTDRTALSYVQRHGLNVGVLDVEAHGLGLEEPGWSRRRTG